MQEFSQVEEPRKLLNKQATVIEISSIISANSIVVISCTFHRTFDNIPLNRCRKNVERWISIRQRFASDLQFNQSVITINSYLQQGSGC